MTKRTSLLGLAIHAWHACGDAVRRRVALLRGRALYCDHAGVVRWAPRNLGGVLAELDYTPHSRAWWPARDGEPGKYVVGAIGGPAGRDIAVEVAPADTLAGVDAKLRAAMNGGPQ